MGTIINKIIFGLLFGFLSWKGLDGLFIYYHSRNLYEIDIKAYEDGGDRSQRYLTIQNGIGVPEYLYYGGDDDYHFGVIYPVISNAQYERLLVGDIVNVFVLVERSEFSRSGNYMLEDSTDLTGLTAIGMEGLSDADIDMFESSNLKISNDAVLIQLGEEPIPFHWNLIMFLLGTVFSFTLFKSFFRRASSVKEYWFKITEKDQQ
ncbi:MAG: hypothetical protein NXI20_19065 [bacterium]|nr:hypothetical protein [bacterium]